MKKTDKELLEFFGLKVGDRVKIDCYQKLFVIIEENIPLFMLTVSTNEYEIVKPIHAICEDGVSGKTLSEIFETHEKELKDVKEKLNAIKAELDKDVEVE